MDSILARLEPCPSTRVPGEISVPVYYPKPAPVTPIKDVKLLLKRV